MFHFTIRDVLWLMVVVAFFAAWRIDHATTARQAVENERLQKTLTETQTRLKGYEEMDARLQELMQTPGVHDLVFPLPPPGTL